MKLLFYFLRMPVSLFLTPAPILRNYVGWARGGGEGVIPVCTFHKVIRIRSVSISNIGLIPILCFANYINRQLLRLPEDKFRQW